uniref:Uncharacterized protein n=1 Tax=Arundo donax TaxID=35708 RepID=A0A0A9H4Z7_ARUDO
MCIIQLRAAAIVQNRSVTRNYNARTKFRLRVIP